MKEKQRGRITLWKIFPKNHLNSSYGAINWDLGLQIVLKSLSEAKPYLGLELMGIKR